MRIIHILAGAGGMYCGSCLHGNALTAALRRMGGDVVLLPVYTPLRTDEPTEPGEPLFFGGLNVYLQQTSFLFRHTPRALDRLLDHPTLLRAVGRRAGSTRPQALGPLTLSMLRGERGRQRKELARLVHWLERERPDVVHLSNVLLLGMARQIARQVDVPVVCTLSGEDLFLEQIPQPEYGLIRNELADRCRDLSAMIALNGYYADAMAAYLPADREKIHVVPPGLNLEGHRPPHDPPRAVREAEAPCTLGFLARIAPEKGLHLLAEALRLLAADPRMPPLRLRAAGYLGQGDRAYLAGIERGLAEAGLAERFEYVGELDRGGKIAFLQSLDLFCLPTEYRESKGLPLLEAWANGVPAIVPRHGAFPELVADTGGGLLCEPNDAHSLATTLAQWILYPRQAAAAGRQAQLAVHQRYHADAMACGTIEVYHAAVSRRGAT